MISTYDNFRRRIIFLGDSLLSFVLELVEFPECKNYRGTPAELIGLSSGPTIPCEFEINGCAADNFSPRSLEIPDFFCLPGVTSFYPLYLLTFLLSLKGILSYYLIPGIYFLAYSYF